MPIGAFSSSGSRIGARQDRDRYRHASEPCEAQLCSGVFRKARAFKKTPDHGWASHGSDAWRYLSLSWRAPMREPEEEEKPKAAGSIRQTPATK